MKKYLILLASMLVGGLGMFSFSAQAASLAGAGAVQPGKEIQSSLLQKVQWGGGCRARCADRWGWGTWEFRRCVRHRCEGGGGEGGYGGCRAVRHHCADRWGWGTWEFRRCLVKRGCAGGGGHGGGWGGGGGY